MEREGGELILEFELKQVSSSSFAQIYSPYTNPKVVK